MASQKKTRKSESAAPPPRKPPAPSGPRLGMLRSRCGPLPSKMRCFFSPPGWPCGFWSFCIGARVRLAR